VHWTVGGADQGNSVSVMVDLPQGTDVALRAEVAGAASDGEFTAYYRFDYPRPDTDDQVRAYAQITDSPARCAAPIPCQPSIKALPCHGLAVATQGPR